MVGMYELIGITSQNTPNKRMQSDFGSVTLTSVADARR